MGKVQAQTDQDATPQTSELTPEEAPIVKTLKELDDKYLDLEKEYEALSQKLLLKYTALQRPLLEERKTLLVATENEGPVTGTPAMQGFWLKAMLNHPAFEETIQKWDEPVLEYLQDIETSHVDDADANKGFKLLFRFAPNPYFENTELVKEYITEMNNPYFGDVDVKEIKSTTVDWKAGKDVTVAKVAKKIKGGGAKKAKQKQEREEPRPSIFRDFFKNLAVGEKLSDEMREQAAAAAMGGGGDDEDSDEGENDHRFLEYLMEQDFQVGSAVRDNIIPRAIRWYTGEAAPDSDEEDEDDEDEEEESGTELAEDDESEDESASPAVGKGKSGSKPKSEKPAQAEECKQQ